MARDELTRIGATFRAGDFIDTVLMVTPDSVQVYDGAIMQRVGPFYLVWTEHHGAFFEHEDEVLTCRIYQRSRT